MFKEKNIILVDCDTSDDWEFHKAMEQATGEKWSVYNAVSNKNHGNMFQKIIRYIKYFAVPFKVAVMHNKLNKVLAWQQFYGLILAFYFRLFRVKNVPSIVVMTFIYKPKKFLVGKIYDRFMRYIVTSKYIKYIIVFSQSEAKMYAEYFNVENYKFKTAILGYEDKTKEVPVENPQNIFLSAGRSNRDYKFLINAWNTRKEQLEIVCDSLSYKSNTHIKILKNCFGDDYLKKIARCYAVVVPLEDVHISSGQLVIIQAMMYGKPIIITQNEAIRDYIVNGKTGLIIEKSEKALSEAIGLLNNQEYYKKMSICERKQYEEKFSLYAMGLEVAKILLN